MDATMMTHVIPREKQIPRLRRRMTAQAAEDDGPCHSRAERGNLLRMPAVVILARSAGICYGIS
jgi:hypothetical protein